jgi:hypothetical protein
MQELRIIITFKQSEKWLYDLIKDKYSAPGPAIKDILAEHFKGNPKKEKEPEKHDLEDELLLRLIK